MTPRLTVGTVSTMSAAAADLYELVTEVVSRPQRWWRILLSLMAGAITWGALVVPPLRRAWVVDRRSGERVLELADRWRDLSTGSDIEIVGRELRERTGEEFAARWLQPPTPDPESTAPQLPLGRGSRAASLGAPCRSWLGWTLRHRALISCFDRRRCGATSFLPRPCLPQRQALRPGRSSRDCLRRPSRCCR